MTCFTVEETRQFIDNAAYEREWVVTDDIGFRDVICPCVYAGEDITEYGHCFCGLFLSREFHTTGKEVQPIPERRPEELL